MPCPGRCSAIPPRGAERHGVFSFLEGHGPLIATGRGALHAARAGSGRARAGPHQPQPDRRRGGRARAAAWSARAGTARAGADHAEVVALRQAGPKARGATLYVHARALRAPRAHAALRGRHHRRPGCGAASWRCAIRTTSWTAAACAGCARAGIEVEVGLLEREAREALGGYWRAHRAGLPRVTWKLAVTLDGKVADRAGRSRWITGPAARRLVHRLRAGADAVVIGAGTARADDPRLTARLRARGRRAPAAARGVRHAPAAAAHAAALRAGAGEGHGRGLRPGGAGRARAGARARAGSRSGGCRWRPGGSRRGRWRGGWRARAATTCCSRAGPTLGTAWLAAGLVDRIALFTAPRVLGAGGLAWCGPLGAARWRARCRGASAPAAASGADSFVMVELEGRGR